MFKKKSRKMACIYCQAAVQKPFTIFNCGVKFLVLPGNRRCLKSRIVTCSPICALNVMLQTGVDWSCSSPQTYVNWVQRNIEQDEGQKWHLDSIHRFYRDLNPKHPFTEDHDPHEGDVLEI